MAVRSVCLTANHRESRVCPGSAQTLALYYQPPVSVRLCDTACLSCLAQANEPRPLGTPGACRQQEARECQRLLDARHASYSIFAVRASDWVPRNESEIVATTFLVASAKPTCKLVRAFHEIP